MAIRARRPLRPTNRTVTRTPSTSMIRSWPSEYHSIDRHDRSSAEPPDGGLWSGPKVATFVKDRFGVEVWPQTGWQWLKDLGFRLVVPRPRHPKAATPAQQKEWL